MKRNSLVCVFLAAICVTIPVSYGFTWRKFLFFFNFKFCIKIYNFLNVSRVFFERSVLEHFFHYYCFVLYLFYHFFFFKKLLNYLLPSIRLIYEQKMNEKYIYTFLLSSMEI